ncbi:hypothetical protein PIB30_063417 [Stylosanthes scabra]|uniref:Uncharacterized protein n=1 Tax=Stylosanthes scabra TaxID=79078 RepID=A0ABU6TNK3_9FABA|nr:hypothetical protein [Stylosanthes scabra]
MKQEVSTSPRTTFAGKFSGGTFVGMVSRFASCVVTDGSGALWGYGAACRDEFESGHRLTICYKWSVIHPQICKPHKTSALSLFVLLFVEMLLPIPNLLTVSDKKDVEKLLDNRRTMGQLKLNVDLVALAVGLVDVLVLFWLHLIWFNEIAYEGQKLQFEVAKMQYLKQLNDLSNIFNGGESGRREWL